MTDDDRDVGELLSRREAVAILAGTSAAWMLGAPLFAETPPCVVRPEQTEGPFFVDDSPKRSDIRSGKPGTPIAIALSVSRLTPKGCTPLRNARVDLWQCDAEGDYDDRALHGHQLTDADGVASFTTIYPGWYSGRTVHIHFKVRADRHEFTSQLYFDDALTDTVHANAPYSSRGRRRVRNGNDWIYRDGGDQLKLNVTKRGGLFALAMQY